jgi:hypothetical protein
VPTLKSQSVGRRSRSCAHTSTHQPAPSPAPHLVAPPIACKIVLQRCIATYRCLWWLRCSFRFYFWSLILWRPGAAAACSGAAQHSTTTIPSKLQYLVHRMLAITSSIFSRVSLHSMDRGSCRFGHDIPDFYAAWPDGQSGAPNCGTCWAVQCESQLRGMQGYSCMQERVPPLLLHGPGSVVVCCRRCCPPSPGAMYAMRRH